MLYSFESTALKYGLITEITDNLRIEYFSRELAQTEVLGCR